jgi:hypothetical protein
MWGADLLNGPINGLEACGKALKVLKINRIEIANQLPKAMISIIFSYSKIN